MKPKFNYKSILQRFMNVVSDREALHFVSECTDLVVGGKPLFSPEEIQEMNRLFDEYEYPSESRAVPAKTKTQPV